jgi:hypothetical protein
MNELFTSIFAQQLKGFCRWKFRAERLIYPFLHLTKSSCENARFDSCQRPCDSGAYFCPMPFIINYWVTDNLRCKIVQNWLKRKIDQLLVYKSLLRSIMVTVRYYSAYSPLGPFSDRLHQVLFNPVFIKIATTWSFLAV